MPQSAIAAIVFSVAIFNLLTTPALSHSGGLNAEGCHNDRKRGTYHCHRSASMPLLQQRVIPASKAFANCKAARAAGAAPVMTGEPGYGPHLDRDGDGIGCE